MLIEMMSHADGYVITETSLVAAGSEGRDAVRGFIKELETAGYIRREMVTTGAGRFAGARYHASFYPEDLGGPDDGSRADSTASDYPTTDEPSRENPVGKTEWENPTLKNTKEEHQKRRESVATLPPPAPTLFGAELAEARGQELEKATAPTEPWDIIAKRAYDGTAGALPFMGMKVIAKWAITQKKADPRDVENVIANLYRGGRAVTKVIVGQALDGIVRQDGTTKTASQRREENNIDLIRWAQEQDARNGEMERRQLGHGS